MLRRLRSELDPAERAAVAARPSAVQPRSDDERRLVRGVLLLHRAVHAERAVEILRVEPGGDDEHRVVDVLEILRHVARLPVLVVRAVRQVILVGRHIVCKISQRVGGRSHLEEEAVAVGGAVVEPLGVALVRRHARAGVGRHPVEAVHQLICAAGVIVVAQELILRRRLRRRGLQRGMRADHPHRHFPSVPRDAPLAHAAIVVRDVLHEPVDRVPRIRALVRLRRALHVRNVVDELALRLELSARVLVDEDVALSREFVVRAENGAVIVCAVRSDAVCGARHQDRIARRRLLRRVHDREELHAVAHRDVDLALDVVRLHVVRRLRRRLRDERCSREQHARDDSRCHASFVHIEPAVILW